MSSNQNSGAKTPYDYFKASGRYVFKSIQCFTMFSYTGVKWLFTHWPNVTWSVIVFILVILHVVSSFSIKSERDRYSKENAELIDSISELNMTPDQYLNSKNKPVQAIHISHDSIKK